MRLIQCWFSSRQRWYRSVRCVWKLERNSCFFLRMIRRCLGKDIIIDYISMHVLQCNLQLITMNCVHTIFLFHCDNCRAWPLSRTLSFVDVVRQSLIDPNVDSCSMMMMPMIFDCQHELVHSHLPDGTFLAFDVMNIIYSMSTSQVSHSSIEYVMMTAIAC
jgi:hypothetical protein